MGSLRHISAILTKEWLYWRRNVCRSIVELLIPFLFMVLLVWAYSRIPTTMSDGGPMYEVELEAISPEDNPMTMGLPNLGKILYEAKVFNKKEKNCNQIGMAPKGHQIVEKMKNYFDQHDVRYMIFESEKDLISCAANPIKDGDRMTNITVGISFPGQVKDRDYSYKLMIDRNKMLDVSENYVDKLKR
eukprot:TRINITY_DN3789_c0_g5_i3.p1 TRINITY_DN3789_c0_g5~~TRINITY_DN3789_c0_g5_i3.p1  ORF type:complete len:188 (+),score=64.49 TRINITY_DN3789_c0_g5_i3:118-681(+)